MRLRATIVIEYEANPADYDGITDPAEMVRIDVEEGDLASMLAIAKSIVITGQEVVADA